MNDRVFSRELIGREVETISGKRIGILEDMVIDTDDGSVRYLLISAAGNVIGGPHKVDENGRIVVETDRIRADGNRLVIN